MIALMPIGLAPCCVALGHGKIRHIKIQMSAARPAADEQEEPAAAE
jgi:hypothetical protein